jgi:hypothetical protein
LENGLKVLALDEDGESTTEKRTIVYQEVLDNLYTILFDQQVNFFISVFNAINGLIHSRVCRVESDSCDTILKTMDNVGDANQLYIPEFLHTADLSNFS